VPRIVERHDYYNERNEKIYGAQDKTQKGGFEKSPERKVPACFWPGPVCFVLSFSFQQLTVLTGDSVCQRWDPEILTADGRRFSQMGIWQIEQSRLTARDSRKFEEHRGEKRRIETLKFAV
jgi:hypothetical protein